MGHIVIINEIQEWEKLEVDIGRLFNTKESYPLLIQAFAALITHSKTSLEFIEKDRGERLLGVILNKDETTLIYTKVSIDKIIKTVIGSSDLTRETKVNFCIQLFDISSRRITRFLNGNDSVDTTFIQVLYASVIEAISCNAKEYYLEKDVYFKDEKIAAKCFAILSTLAYIVKDSEFTTTVVEMAVNSLRANNIDFSQAFYWHPSILQQISHNCVVLAKRECKPFYCIMRAVSLNF